MVWKSVAVKFAKAIVPATAGELATAEAALGSLPKEYASYVKRFGAGVLSDWVRVLPPAELAKTTREFRERMSEYWFWTESEKALPQSRAQECVPLADTLGGDELIFHPSDLATFYKLPRDGARAKVLPGGFRAALMAFLGAAKAKKPVFRPFRVKPHLCDHSPRVTGVFSNLKRGVDRNTTYLSGVEVAIIGSSEGYFAIVQQHADKPFVTRVTFDFEATGGGPDGKPAALEFELPKSSSMGPGRFKGSVHADSLRGVFKFDVKVTKYSTTSRESWEVQLPRTNSHWQ